MVKSGAGRSSGLMKLIFNAGERFRSRADVWELKLYGGVGR